MDAKAIITNRRRNRGEYNMKQTCRILFATVALLALMTTALIVSCGDTGTSGDVKTKWTVNAVVAHDANVGQAHAYLALTRDGTAYSAALVTLQAPSADSADTISLAGAGDGTYRVTFSPRQLRDTTYIKVESLLDQFQFSYQLSLPESLGIEVVDLPNNLVLASTQQVQLRWQAPKFAKGYILVVQPALSSNLAVGYKKILGSSDYTQDPPYLTTLIPRETFRNTQGVFQPGAFNVWIAAYADSPINTNELPFVLPVGFASNLNRAGVTGQVGGLFIGKKVVLTAVAPT
jgi:hypothetical protein